jgi:hypothetical protein
MTNNLTTGEQPDRSKINMNQIHEVRYWTKHLNVSKEELQKAIEKVGIQPPPSARNWRWPEGVGYARDLWSEAPTLGRGIASSRRAGLWRRCSQRSKFEQNQPKARYVIGYIAACGVREDL